MLSGQLNEALNWGYRTAPHLHCARVHKSFINQNLVKGNSIDQKQALSQKLMRMFKYQHRNQALYCTLSEKNRLSLRTCLLHQKIHTLQILMAVRETWKSRIDPSIHAAALHKASKAHIIRDDRLAPTSVRCGMADHGVESADFTGRDYSHNPATSLRRCAAEEPLCSIPEQIATIQRWKVTPANTVRQNQSAVTALRGMDEVGLHHFTVHPTTSGERERTVGV
ncbi:hypothetical protein TcWFU_005197 [Taenia crassiceps]|uniref:Uncharacterized protein n=1 Tax=Taenia crassiceps TaxID=6207 RepID=A0ABR4QGU5_9CEST